MTIQITTAVSIERNIEKLLSRILCHSLPPGFEAVNAFKKATDEYPEAFCYLVNLPGLGQWMGASPELLANVEDKKINTVALAGTQPNSGQQPDNINWGEKELHEQRLVTDHIRQCLQQFCSEIKVSGPNTVTAGNLFHLRTDFSANLPLDNSSEALKALLHKMHPTPAIAGSPKEAALKLIAEVGNAGKGLLCRVPGAGKGRWEVAVVR